MVRKVCFIVLVVIAIEIISFSRFPRTLRPISIRVIDSVTKEPLSGIAVYYKAESAQNRHIFWIPVPLPTIYRWYFEEKLHTNEDGWVKIPKRYPWLRLYESIDWEYIKINLDSTGVYFEDILWSNPRHDYRGVMIINALYYFGPENVVPPPEDAVFERMFNSYSLGKKDEEIIVELTKWE